MGVAWGLVKVFVILLVAGLRRKVVALFVAKSCAHKRWRLAPGRHENTPRTPTLSLSHEHVGHEYVQ